LIGSALEEGNARLAHLAAGFARVGEVQSRVMIFEKIAELEQGFAEFLCTQCDVPLHFFCQNFPKLKLSSSA
jgi:hypothetical protein